MGNFKNLQFGKFGKIQFENFQKSAIWQIQKNSIWKFSKICNLKNIRIGEIASTAEYRMDEWGSKFRTTEYKTTDISEFRNFEY